MKDIKKAIIGVITLAITTAGGLLINKLIGGDDEEPTKTEVTTPSPTNVIINIPEQKKDTVVKKVYVKPVVKKTKTEKRKEEIDW
jgi:hypothetical protein